MKQIVKNLTHAFRRFKMANVLNIVGLSISFASFIVIMMQVSYDYNFDKGIKGYEHIYRVDIVHGGGQKQAVISRPFAELIFKSSPRIEAGAISNPFFGGELFFGIDKAGVISYYKEKSIFVSPSFTNVFHFDIVEGEKDVLNEPDKVLVPKSMAEKLFGSETALDRQLKLSGKNIYTIGGVYRDFPRNSSLQNCIYIAMPENENVNNWGNWNYNVYIRLNGNNPVDTTLLNDNFRKNLPEDLNIDFSKGSLQFTQLPDLHYTTDVLYDNSPKSSRQTIAVLFAIAFVIVIIAAVNFMNFSVAQTPMRIKGINTQKVLGATDTGLRLSLLAEAILISVLAYLLSLALVFLVSRSPVADMVDMDIALRSYPVLIGMTAALAILTGILSGLYPAYYITSFPPAVVLKGSFGLSPKGRKLRNMLIGFQFVISLVLMMVAGFMYLQNRFMQDSPLGYDKDALIVTDINNNINQSRDVFTEELHSFSGIEGVAYAQFLLSSSEQYMGWGREYRGKNIQYQCLPVDPDFLEVMGIDVVEGRGFRESDKDTENGVYVFNEKARSDYDLELNHRIDDAEIVGFIPDIKFASFRTEMAPMAFYVWGTQNWGRSANYAYVRVKAGSNLGAALQHVKEVLDSIDPDYPFHVRFYDEVLNQLYEKEQKISALITLFSLIAIILSMVGVFGLVIFESEYRRKETGIRKVLGSSVGEILALLNKTYLITLSVCFVIAIPIASFAVIKWLENFVFRTPIYWWVFVLAGLAVLLITLVTISWQSWRAATANPVDSLKTE
ncbi:ABC transporter permease [Proteiniphilum sp. UBA5384]|uniref:ABC transporter permease n=1 Tax=Proteiniphilum sp. UBA5384 TaxID=1947279 RepID=UPI0025E265DC|nr:ABC transporter permease [Proteiniphilum sp. UBA5384]